MSAVAFDLVIPTVGRPSLLSLLTALAEGQGPRPRRIFLVDDRRRTAAPLPTEGVPSSLEDHVCVVWSRAGGPAAARNVGWRAAGAPWIAFLDDDVIPEPAWASHLVDDLAGLPGDVAGSQGRIRVPRPTHRRPTDWERNVAGLEHARWATADMAYRRDVLEAVGGFDERFRRAYREDADLALRVLAAGFRLVRGQRIAIHPVRPADGRVSVRLQAGNADDVLMRARHGRHWRRRAGVPAGRRPRHLAITAATVATAIALARGHRRLGAAVAATALAGTAELAWARIAPGPRTPREIATMLATSLVLPHAATLHWLLGLAAVLFPGRSPSSPATSEGPAPRPVRAVLFDRDGTLVVDVPYNGDPKRVVPMPGARQALDRLRAAGVPVAVVSNQSGVARGLVSADQVTAVNRRIEELVGPLGHWFVCPHGPDAGCGCHKPAPGLVERAARALGVRPGECALIGDTGDDVQAARAAGARAILVPTPVTRREEIATAREVAPTIAAAVDRLLESCR